MEKSFPKYKETNPNALKYAAAQLLNSNRMGTGYPNNEWEAKDTVKNPYGHYEYNDPATRMSNYKPQTKMRSAVMDTLDQFQSDYYNTARTNLGTQIGDLQNYATANTAQTKRGLTSSQSVPIINGTAGGFPMNPFVSPYLMQVQYPVAQLDMDWYIRQCK